MSTLTVTNITDPLNAGVYFPFPPRTTTMSVGDNTTALATTAFVTRAVANSVGFPITIGSTVINNGSTNVSIAGLTLTNATIGSTNPGPGSFTTLNTTSTTSLNATTINSLACSNVAITGGNINGTPLGSSVPAAATFTTLATTGNVNLTSSTVTVPTAAPGTNSNVVASTAFVTTAVSSVSTSIVSLAAPPGAVCLFVMQTTTSAPTGWLKANGASVLRTDFPNLYAVIGTMFGAVDGTHFNLPELRGEFLRCLDDSRGVDNAVTRTIGSAQAYQLAQHNHSTSYGVYDRALPAGSAQQISGGQQNLIGYISTNNAGGSENGGESRPRNIALLACIKF